MMWCRVHNLNYLRGNANRADILSLPPSWFTASTKHSWSSGVHLIRCLATEALLLLGGLATGQISLLWDEADWFTAGSDVAELEIWIMAYNRGSNSHEKNIGHYNQYHRQLQDYRPTTILKSDNWRLYCTKEMWQEHFNFPAVTI